MRHGHTTPYKRTTHRPRRWFSARDGVTPLVTARRLAEIVLVGHGGETVVGAVVVADPPDLALVDALLRVRLWAARAGRVVVLRAVDDELAALFSLVGVDPRGGLQRRRKTEGVEQVGVEEEVHPGDPVA